MGYLKQIEGKFIWIPCEVDVTMGENISSLDIDVFACKDYPNCPYEDHCKEPIHFEEPFNNLADLLVALNIFESKGEAKRNNWSKPIESGYSQHRFKGGAVVITIWYPSISRAGL